MDENSIVRFKSVDSQAELQECYPLLAEACERISSRQAVPAFAPDVYAALLQGKAQMAVGFVGEEPHGFFTAYVVEHPCQPPQLHIWHGYIRPGSPKQCLVDAFAELERIAREKGCSQLVFGTRRRGWERNARRVGMVLRDYTFFKGVSSGNS